jgi:DNA-binding CsgD family transcriptional regulator
MVIRNMAETETLQPRARKRRTGTAPRKARSVRRYQPDIEALEAIQVMNAAVPGVADLAQQSSIYQPEPTWQTSDTSTQILVPDQTRMADSSALDAWDAALAAQADQLTAADYALADDFSNSLSLLGYDRMERYLNRAWQKAGIAPPQDEDCTQSVYMVLLQRWGRDNFENLATHVGRDGLSTLVTRETPVGLDFLRALDQIKKQAQRQMSRQTMLVDESSATASTRGYASPDEIAMGRDMERLIQATLAPREAELIRSTIDGETPSEIAARWGVSAKTVSNVKSEALHKLRTTLNDKLDIDFHGQ